MKPYLFALFAFLPALPFPAAAEKPNIVFILADDLGWADTTLYGHTSLYETPHLERLAARGMTFDRAYTASPLCSPTRSSILTGLHPARTGLTAPNCHTPKINLQATASDTAAPNRKLTAYDSVTRLDPNYETLAERYRKEGYTTAHFGKWHLGAEPYSPFEHGFDIDIPHHPGPGPAGSFVAPWKFKNFTEKYPKEHIEDRMGDEVVAFMEQNQDRPFFLNYWQFSVHAPFDAKAELIEKYRGKIDPNDEQRSPTYAAMVQSLDDNVGKMLDALDRLKIADNTIIVFFSDNGGNMYNDVDGTTPTSNRPLRGGKANNWDGGVRVPAVIVWPGTVEPGSRNDSLITSTDFYPTLLEMTGMKPSREQQFDGVSIVPALKGETQERGPIFTFFPHSTNVPDTLPPSASVYVDNWKLLRLLHNGENGAHDDRLFNLTEDIGERNNVAADNPDRAAAMAKQLDEFLKDTGAVYPKYNPQYDPVSAKIGGTGLKPIRNCSLALDNDELLVKATGANSHVTLALKQALAPGDLKLRLHLRAPHPGNIALRWSEKGVKPLFFKDRLEHSKPFEGGTWETVTIPFSAAQAVTSFRIDFMTPAGEIRVGKIEVIRDGEVTGIWSVPVAGTQWLDLQEQFRRAAKSSPQIREEPLTADGRTLDGIFQHAEAPGSPLATIQYPAFQLPAVGNGIDKIELRFLIGFKDGESFVEAQSDGCRFVITANGKEVFGKEYARQAWQSHSIDLTEFSGKEVILQWQVDPLVNSAADWASWANPGLWLHGDATAIAKQLRTATSLPTHYPVSQLQEKLAPSDRTFRHSENHHIAVMDEHLDLATATERLSKDLPPAKVPLAPQMVVGEGAHPDNHTLIQVLSPYGIAEVQFLAFPPSVRGGVEVECLGKFIAATPIQQGSVGQVTLFDQSGIAQQTIEPPFDGPYVLASGDFLEGDGELLAIASSRGGSAALYDSGGQRIQSFEIPKGKTQISDGNRRLLVYTDPKRLLTTIDFPNETREERSLDFLPAGRSVFASAFHKGHLWAGGPQPLRSHVYDIKPDNTFGGKDVGVEENEFWLGLPKEFEEELGVFEGKKDAQHIRFAKYGHMRVDATSPRYTDPENGDAFGGTAFVADLRKRGAFLPLTKQARKMWNPTFTHRQFRQLFVDWARQTDPETGLNQNMMQSQLGNIGGFEQLGEKGLISSTYAPGNEAMQGLYTETLRSFLREWAPLYRANPAMAPSIEPNHEFESAVAVNQSVGDYNPHMIRGFYEWLIRNYGEDPAAREKLFGVRFDEFFDAPRGLGRASWDRYSLDNRFLLAWIEFNRHVINRTLALTYREALLAGIPPEMIRCHQIPDTYAIPRPLKGVTRITPIDYAMTAGVGFGFTKFGVNYDQPDTNIINATRTSGFDSFVMGEFQPLRTEAEIVEKELRYVFESGAKAIHPLYWGSNHTGRDKVPDDEKKNRTLHAALQNLILEDPPRPGQAGGIGQVRPWQKGKQKFHVVSIGTGPDHTGLIKSVRADGRMEGTVYVIPFHQRIRVTVLGMEKNTIEIARAAHGSQVEISGSAASPVSIRVSRFGSPLPDLGTELKGDFRYTLRLPERIDGLTVSFSGDEFQLTQATLQQPEAADIHTRRHSGLRHQGGVSFDLVE